MYRRNMSEKLKKVVMFIRLSILLLLSRPFSDDYFGFPRMLIHNKLVNDWPFGKLFNFISQETIKTVSLGNSHQLFIVI